MRKSLSCSIIILFTIISGSAFAKPLTAENIYKKIGGVAALSEKCLGSFLLSNKVKSTLINFLFNNPEMMSAVGPLIASYKVGYDKATSDAVMWIGIGHGYGKIPYVCSNPKDIKTIKSMEKKLVKEYK